MAKATSELIEAYRTTSYLVDIDVEHQAVIRIGAVAAELDGLLAAEGSVTWGYLTAWNPLSHPCTSAENSAQNQMLLAEIQIRGFSYRSGRGVGTSEWPAEESFLILGISRDETIELARRFRQYGAVVGERGGVAELVLLEF